MGNRRQASNSIIAALVPERCRAAIGHFDGLRRESELRDVRFVDRRAEHTKSAFNMVEYQSGFE